jgi:hypothetical protein
MMSLPLPLPLPLRWRWRLQPAATPRHATPRRAIADR